VNEDARILTPMFKVLNFFLPLLPSCTSILPEYSHSPTQFKFLLCCFSTGLVNKVMGLAWTIMLCQLSIKYKSIKYATNKVSLHIMHKIITQLYHLHSFIIYVKYYYLVYSNSHRDFDLLSKSTLIIVQPMMLIQICHM